MSWKKLFQTWEYAFKIYDLLVFLVIMLFSSLCSYPKIICGGGAHFQKVARLWKHSWGRFLFDNLKKFLAELSFHFHRQLWKKIEWLVSYVRKKESIRKQSHSKWNKDFLTETGFLRSLLLIINKKVDQIISKLLTFSKCFTCVLIATFCFEMWNIFEHALRFFIIDNN